MKDYTYDEILCGAHKLYEAGYFKNVSEVLYYFEKPYKYEQELQEIDDEENQ